MLDKLVSQLPKKSVTNQEVIPLPRQPVEVQRLVPIGDVAYDNLVILHSMVIEIVEKSKSEYWDKFAEALMCNPVLLTDPGVLEVLEECGFLPTTMDFQLAD